MESLIFVLLIIVLIAVIVNIIVCAFLYQEVQTIKEENAIQFKRVSEIDRNIFFLIRGRK